MLLFTSLKSDETVAERTSTQFYPVGELGALWQFPSDHLPVGGTVGPIHFVAWNILDTRYLFHIVKNDQGLKESLILESNVPAHEGSALTKREEAIVQHVLAMIDHAHFPKALVALEETGANVFLELNAHLPRRIELIPSTLEELGHGDLFLYDTEVFDFVDFDSHRYEVHPGNSYMTLTLREKTTGIIYRFVQSHVPGGPVKSAPARQELAEALMQDFDPKAVTLVMGDMNRSPDYFLDDFEQAAIQCGFEKQPFTNLWVPYATHINTHMEASWIDNLFIAAPDPKLPIHVAGDASEFFEEMQNTLDLLENIKNETVPLP